MSFSLRRIVITFVLSILAVSAGLVWYFYAHAPESAVVVPSGAQIVTPTPVPTSAQSDEPLVESGLPRGGVTTLQNLQFTPAAEVAKELYPEGSGIVVRLGGQTRFYPYQILRLHEVAEDVFAQTPLAVTYCALCNVGVVYDRSVNGQVIHVRVSGVLSGLDSLLEDVDTGTLWSQVSGKAVRGPLRGLSLGVVESQTMTLKAFAAQYPYGEVLRLPVGDEYRVLSYGDAAARPDAEAYMKQHGFVHPKTDVLGMIVDGTPYAIAADAVGRSARTVALGTRRVSITPLQGGGYVAEVKGERIPVFAVPWFLWEVYYPEAKLVKETK